MKNFKNRKTNLMKIGKGALLFTSLALPISIVSKKTDASPINKNSNPFKIATSNQMRRLLSNPYSGGEADTPKYRYHSFLSGIGTDTNTDKIYSTTLTTKHSSLIQSGQAKVVLGDVKPTPLKLRSSLSVRLQAQPQSAIITQQGTNSQGQNTMQLSSQQIRRGTNGSTQQSRRGSNGSSSGNQGVRRLSSSSKSQTSDTDPSDNPQQISPIATGTLEGNHITKLEGKHIQLPRDGETIILSDTSTSTDTVTTKPLTPVSANVSFTEIKSQTAKIENQNWQKGFAKIKEQTTGDTPIETASRRDSASSTGSSQKPITPNQSKDKNIQQQLEGKFATTPEGDIVLLVKAKSSTAKKTTPIQEPQTSEDNITTPQTPSNTPSTPQRFPFSRVEFLRNYFDGLSSKGNDSTQQPTKPISGVNVRGLRERFENQNNQTSGRVNSTKDIRLTGQVSNKIDLFEKGAIGSRVIFPNNNPDDSNNNASSQKKPFVPNSNVNSLRGFFENQNNQITKRNSITNLGPTGQVSNRVTFFEKLSGTQKITIPKVNNTSASGNTTSTSNSSSSNITNTSSTSSTTNTTTTLTQTNTNNNSTSKQTRPTPSANNTNFTENNPNDGNQRGNEDFRQNNTNPHKLTMIRLNLKVVDNGDIDRIIVRTKIKIG